MFLFLFHFTWWLRTHSKKMVDYEVSLQGWLEDATLFPSAESSNYGLDFNGLLGKSTLDDHLPDIEWLDTKTDFPDLENTNLPQQSSDSIDLEDAANLLLDLVDGDLSFDVSKANLEDIFNLQDIPLYEDISQASSPNSLDDASEVSSLYPCSSPCLLGDSDPVVLSPSDEAALQPGAVSPVCSTDSIFEDSTVLKVEEVLTEASSPVDSFASSEDGSLFVYSPDVGYNSIEVEEASPAVVTVTVYNSDSPSPSEDSDSLDEERVRHHKRIAPRTRHARDPTFHPYATGRPKRQSEKAERKKTQNKEAAARYRIKKRIEEKELLDEVETLEQEQSELKQKYDALKSEIKYLKNLMKEVLQKRGVL